MKYIVEIAKEYEEYFKGILICGIVEGKFAVDVIAKEDLEELTSDYINEHYGSLQDDAYQRGLEDGKAQSKRGCEGCRYECENKRRVPCILCSNNFKLPCTISSSKLTSQWTAKGDKIEVGDEVNWLGDCFIVTRIFQPHNMREQCDGIDDDGCVYRDILMDDLEKTGRHFNIQSILEAMRND